MRNFGRYKWLVLLIAFSTAFYISFYWLVRSNPQFFLTEFSSTIYQSSSSSPSPSNSTEATLELPISHEATATVTHWGWLNYAHQKYISNVMMLVASVFLCSYFRSLLNLSKGDTVQNLRQRLIAHKIGNAFAIYGLFISFYTFSLIFLPVTPYDSVLYVILAFIALILLAVSGIYLLAKTKRESGKKLKVGNMLTVLGIFLSIWLVASSLLGEAFLPFVCLLIIGVIILFFLGKLAKNYYNKIVQEIS